jgi:hypothetical protein
MANRAAIQRSPAMLGKLSGRKAVNSAIVHCSKSWSRGAMVESIFPLDGFSGPKVLLGDVSRRCYLATEVPCIHPAKDRRIGASLASTISGSDPKCPHWLQQK